MAVPVTGEPGREGRRGLREVFQLYFFCHGGRGSTRIWLGEGKEGDRRRRRSGAVDGVRLALVVDRDVGEDAFGDAFEFAGAV